MHKKQCRSYWLFLCLCLLSISVAATEVGPINFDKTYRFDIPSQNVKQALTQLAKQTDVQLLFSYESVSSLQSSAVAGELTINSALQQMLHGTNLSGSLTERGVIVVTAVGAFGNSEGINNMNSKKNLLASTIAFFVGSGGVLAQGDAPVEGGGFVLEEIVVTASRRETNLNDTAISVAAIGGEEISRRNLSEMNDYLRVVPGVNYIETGVGQNAVIIRGIGINPQNESLRSSATTGVYFGEVPLTGLNLLGGSANIKMIDLERVEILRGPQGTLFGSGALAGVVRNVPNAPKLDGLEGSVKTSYSNTEKHGGDNTKIEAVVNVPLVEDVLAVRAVAYRHDNSGYIKNIAGTQRENNGLVFPGLTAQNAIDLAGGAELYQDENNVGNTEYTGGRVAVLWEPVDRLSVTLQHLYQDVKEEGQPYVELGFDDYEQVTLQFGGEEIAGKDHDTKDKINITNLVLQYDLGWASILSSSSWLEEESSQNVDTSSFGGFPFAAIWGTTQDLFAEELRLVSQMEGSFQYVVGVYYEDSETSGEFNDQYASTDEALNFFLPFFGFTSPPFEGSLQSDRSASSKSIEQLAYYGELSYSINEQFELTLGARRFDYERVKAEVGDGLFGRMRNTESKTDEADTTFKANLSYRPNDETMLYAQWAEGFRLGNSNPEIPRSTCDVNNDGVLDGTATPIKDAFDSDTIENFEVGAKLSFGDRLQVNTAIYRMDWEGIPLLTAAGKLDEQDARICFDGIVSNAGKARSQGIEIESTYYLTQGLRISLGGSYNNSELTEDAPSVGGVSGDRLPSSPEYNVNVGLQYEFGLGGHPSYVAGDYSYVGEFYNRLNETGVKTGGYGQVNMSAGIAFSQFNFELFAHNLTDEDALTHADTSAFDDRAYQLRPRTIGLNVGYQF